jgi:SAM-dependent methyltransferase
VGRLFEAALGAMDLFGVYVGDRLGLYRALADAGPLTSSGLAEAAGVHERYAREWLEQQAATGILEVDDVAAAATERRFSLPAAYEEVFLDEMSLNYAGPFGKLIVAATKPIEELLEAFRTGAGVPYEHYGQDLVEGQAAFTRPMFTNLLGSEWLPAVPAVHQRLLAEPPARVADVACGAGWSSIAIARAYPLVHVDGIDLDTASIAKARENLSGSDVDNRVTFHERDAADQALAGQYDLVTIFEALHDMSYPVEVLRTLRGMLGEGGSVIVGDEPHGGQLPGARERARAHVLRLQLPSLPARRHGRRGPGGDGNRHADGDRAGLHRGRRVLVVRGAADRERLLALLPAYAVS